MSDRRIHRSDCIAAMRTMPDASIDAIVTDPPYELGFMGKVWDASGIAYDPLLWTEALRVLKPGGHLLAFGATRTYHRMAVAIEDAGFEIRDSIHWIYGSGFPKSLDVSKAIDKAAGAEREVLREKTYQPTDGGGYSGNLNTSKPRSESSEITAPATPEAAKWQGWGTALKPAHEPIIVARKPLDGTVAANVLAHGTGALNIDGCRVKATDKTPFPKAGYGRAESDASYEFAGDPKFITTGIDRYTAGRWPANIVLTHSVGCRQIGTSSDTYGGGAKATSGFVDGYEHDGFQANTAEIAVWQCESACPVSEMNAQSNDTGGASRYFTNTEWHPIDDEPPFQYVAKASKKERNAGLEDANTHPTVKPVALMRWLVRLVTPPNGTVFDPFLGSGTTAVAATLEGLEWVGCEMTEDYWPIIEARVEWAEQQACAAPEAEMTLFGDAS